MINLENKMQNLIFQILILIMLIGCSKNDSSIFIANRLDYPVSIVKVVINNDDFVFEKKMNVYPLGNKNISFSDFYGNAGFKSGDMLTVEYIYNQKNKKFSCNIEDSHCVLYVVFNRNELNSCSCDSLDDIGDY